MNFSELALMVMDLSKEELWFIVWLRFSCFSSDVILCSRTRFSDNPEHRFGTPTSIASLTSYSNSGVIKKQLLTPAFHVHHNLALLEQRKQEHSSTLLREAEEFVKPAATEWFNTFDLPPPELNNNIISVQSSQGVVVALKCLLVLFLFFSFLFFFFFSSTAQPLVNFLSAAWLKQELQLLIRDGTSFGITLFSVIPWLVHFLFLFFSFCFPPASKI